MDSKKLKDLKPGQFFTRKPIDAPTEKQVYVRCAYDRTQKKYECQSFSDISRCIYLKGETEVYTDFIF